MILLMNIKLCPEFSTICNVALPNTQVKGTFESITPTVVGVSVFYVWTSKHKLRDFSDFWYISLVRARLQNCGTLANLITTEVWGVLECLSDSEITVPYTGLLIFTSTMACLFSKVASVVATNILFSNSCILTSARYFQILLKNVCQSSRHKICSPFQVIFKNGSHSFIKILYRFIWNF